MALSIVSIVKGKDPKVMMKKAIDLLGGLDSYVKSGQMVLIKPNVCGGVPGKPGSFTNPEVLASVIKLLREIDVEVYVGEADSCMYSPDVMLQETGIREVAMKHGAEVVNLSHGDMVSIDVPDGYVFRSLNVNRVVVDADAIIAMPVMKTHGCTVVTLGMKTMYGILPEKKKSKYHRKLNRVIVDIVSALKPKLTIIDGRVGMEGEGPFYGDIVKLDLIIAGNNVVSTDACAAAVMGFDPESIEHLRLASERGLGAINIDDIEIIGEKIDSVKRPFVPATPYRLPTLSRISTERGYWTLHKAYEGAVQSWKNRQK